MASELFDIVNYLKRKPTNAKGHDNEISNFSNSPFPNLKIQ